MRARGLSPRTIKAYLFHVGHFLKIIQDPINASFEDIQRYFLGLCDKLDSITINLRISSVKFFYTECLKAKVFNVFKIKTAQIYTHASTAVIKNIKSPLATLGITSQGGTKSEQK
ncbi:MAG: phage integrase N-terminal SAM-like domain-containing protein [Candidatus Aenigmarchaeota archaeon]|nr:phage integrase N-terminal SAM-like domain-containing protein [Candidatus Aenigmarchaeota archaeon]